MNKGLDVLLFHFLIGGTYISLFIEIKIKFPTLLKDVNEVENLIIKEAVFVTVKTECELSGTSHAVHLAQCCFEREYFINSGSLRSFS